MKSRLTIATITVLGLLGLVLTGLLALGLQAERATAQRLSLPEQRQTLELAPANAPPAFVASDSNQFSQAGSISARSTGGPATRYGVQPHRGLSVASTQPIVVDIKDGLKLSGEPVNLAAFELETIFGPVSIPVNTVAGLRTADDPRQLATVCLSNGDSLTGVLATESVTIKTAWGGATIGREHIVSIVTTAEPIAWQRHDGRWRIAPAKPVMSEADGEEIFKPSDQGNASEPPKVIYPST